MFDIHNSVLVSNPAEDLSIFGFSSIGVVFSNKYDSNLFKKIKENCPLNVYSGVEISAKQGGEVQKKVKQLRNQVDIIFVKSEDNRAIRAAVANPSVDAISHAFVDQTSARDAGANNVALEINLSDLLSVYGMKRASLISKIKFNLSLARKYKVPLVLTTGATKLHDMRSPRQLRAIVECIGFTPAEAKSALSTTPAAIIKKNRDKRTGKAIAEGVRRV